MPSEVITFEKELLSYPGVLDHKGVHHEFFNGDHGPKVNMDAIPANSRLFSKWVTVTASFLRNIYDPHELQGAVLLSVANGTNRLVEPVSDELDGITVPLETEKDNNKQVFLSDYARQYINLARPPLVIALEDVGTTGMSAAMAVADAIKAGAKRAEVATTFQRRHRLEVLLGIGAVHHSIIKHVIEDFSPKECREAGYCARDWSLIKYGE